MKKEQHLDVEDTYFNYLLFIFFDLIVNSFVKDPLNFHTKETSTE